MKEEELIKKLESVKLPQIELESHRRRLRTALLNFEYFKEQQKVGAFTQAKSKMKGGIDMLRRLISWRPVWKPALVSALAIALIVGSALFVPSLVGPSPEVLAAEIAQNSPEVKLLLGDNKITIMGLGVENGEAMVICVAATRPPVAAKVDLKAKKVTDVVEVSVPKLSKAGREEAINIAKADPKVKELLDKGATISEVYPAILSSITRLKFTSVSSGGTSEGYGLDATRSKMACVAIELGDESWGILINFDSRKVDRILKPSPMKTIKSGEPVHPKTSPPPMAQIEEVKNIAKADPGVQELLGKGATICAIGPYSTGVITISENDGIRMISFPVASQDKFEVIIEMGKEKHWAVLVNLAKKRVESITETEWPRGIVYRTSVHRISGSEVPRK